MILFIVSGTILIGVLNMRDIGITSKYGEISEPGEKGTTKINFLAPSIMAKKIKVLSNQLHWSQSEIIRKALEFFITEYEKEKIAREIEEACDLYYDIDKRLAAEWRGAESKVL